MRERKNTPAPLNILLRIVLVIFMIAFLAISMYSNDEANPELKVTPTPTATPVPTPTPTPMPTPTPTPTPEPEYFEITMIGDCTLASSQYEKNYSYSFESVIGEDMDYVFAKTLDYFTDDDFTIANLECALTESTAAANKTFLFKSKPEYGQIMKNGSVEFVTLGNNHVLDYGQQGYDDTKAAMEELGIGYAGRDEWSIYETESGLKIGVYAVSFGEVSQIEAGIKALRDEGAEFIIAALHWGDEGAYTVNSLQVKQGHAAIDAGAHIVYGSHPHTLQKHEEYNGGHIYYSMGNWSFGGNANPRDKDTVIVKIIVMRDIDGTISIAERKVIPCASSGEKSSNNYQPVPYEEGSEEYLRTLSKIDGTFTGANLSIGYEYTYGEVAG